MITLCPECDVEVQAELQKRLATISVRGESTAYIETVALVAASDARLE